MTFRNILLAWLVAMGPFVLSYSAAAAATREKIELKVLYAGHPGTDREKEFIEFLRLHFTEASTADLAKFTATSAGEFDVVLLDYDGDGFKSPMPAISGNYTKPTVTLSVTGGLICSQLRLKTGYM